MSTQPTHLFLLLNRSPAQLSRRFGAALVFDSKTKGAQGLMSFFEFFR